MKNIINYIKTLKEDIEQNMPHILMKQELRSERNLKDNPNLILTADQSEWIKKLEINGCEIMIDDSESK